MPDVPVVTSAQRKVKRLAVKQATQQPPATPQPAARSPVAVAAPPAKPFDPMTVPGTGAGFAAVGLGVEGVLKQAKENVAPVFSDLGRRITGQPSLQERKRRILDELGSIRAFETDERRLTLAQELRAIDRELAGEPKGPVASEATATTLGRGFAGVPATFEELAQDPLPVQALSAFPVEFPRMGPVRPAVDAAEAAARGAPAAVREAAPKVAAGVRRLAREEEGFARLGGTPPELPVTPGQRVQWDTAFGKFKGTLVSVEPAAPGRSHHFDVTIDAEANGPLPAKRVTLEVDTDPRFGVRYGLRPAGTTGVSPKVGDVVRGAPKPKAPAKAATATAKKEPWEMTIAEVNAVGHVAYDVGKKEWFIRPRQRGASPPSGGFNETNHERLIAMALADGKPVPEAVLNDYPHLLETLGHRPKSTTAAREADAAPVPSPALQAAEPSALPTSPAAPSAPTTAPRVRRPVEETIPVPEELAAREGAPATPLRQARATRGVSDRLGSVARGPKVEPFDPFTPQEGSQFEDLASEVVGDEDAASALRFQRQPQPSIPDDLPPAVQDEADAIGRVYGPSAVDAYLANVRSGGGAQGAAPGQNLNNNAQAFLRRMQGPTPPTVLPKTPAQTETAAQRYLQRVQSGQRGVPPSPPPPSETAQAAAQPPRSAGNRFVAPLRGLGEVQAEVVTSDNPAVRALIGRTGINPSILQNNPAGKAMVAFMRQRIAADELTDTAIQAALDTHAQRFTGSMKGALRIDKSGVVEGTGKRWEDVFSRPGDFNLTPQQRAYIDDFRAVIDEAEAMRVSAGLKPRAKTGPDGWFYVPRQVEGIRGTDLRRPSSANLQRIYDEATEGAKRGIKYSNNPRENLRLHLRAAYKEVADKQLSDALEPLSLGPKALVPEPVRTRMEQAVRQRMATERAGRAAILEARKKLARPADSAKQVTARQKDLADLEATIRKAAADNDAVRAQYQAAKNVYSKAMEAARSAEIANGALFGMADETIPIAQWRNRFYPREQAEALEKGLGKQSQKVDGPWFTQLLQGVANHTRFLSSVGDFAAPLTHGLPVLARRPDVWAKSTWNHFKAFADPTVQARFAREHVKTLQEMAQHGIPIGDPEFFAALKEGQGIGLETFGIGNALEQLPRGKEARALTQSIGRQTGGRFQAAYNTSLGMNRALMWEALAPSWKGDKAGLAQYIRNLTGGLDTRALGIGPNARAAESLWLAFSPRLLRSTVSLTGMALRPGTPQGRQALRSLSQLAAGVVGAYILTGLAMGKTEEEITTGLSPLSGKKFLSHNVNGDWIGVGGQIRAIAQLLAGTADALAPGGKEPQALIELTPNNPLVAFYTGRGPLGFNIAATAFEGGSQGKVNAYPYGAPIVGWPDVGKHLGTAQAPFTLQAFLEGQQALTLAAGLGGLRTSPPSAVERRVAAAARTPTRTPRRATTPAPTRRIRALTGTR